MRGADVAKAMKEDLIRQVAVLKEKDILPNLVIIRVGSRPDDLAYERGAKKRMETVGIACKVIELPRDITQNDFEQTFRRVNEDPSVHGILLFRPLPENLDEEPVRKMICPQKDVDGMSPVNMAKVFAGDDSGFAPCTAEAVMEMLHYYKIDPAGKRVTVLGRSMVVGRPLAMLLLKEHATVTLCHTRTADLAGECKRAEILIAAAGKAKLVTDDMIAEGAAVADVGINVDAAGKLCGDVNYEAAETKTAFISPVPGGVGSVTASVLAKHVVQSALHTSTLKNKFLAI